MGLSPNTLYYGDCLEWLPRFPSESVDLIYLDPPFNSNASYNLLFGNGQPKRSGARSAQVQAFDDTWRWDDAAAKRVDRLSRAAAHPAHKAVMGLRVLMGEGGMLAYLSYMAERLAEMPRILKSTGSIYLHCDPTASHGLKLVMDTIFNPANFRNEITWRRSNPKSLGRINFPNCRDTILRYSKTKTCTFNQVYGPHDPAYVNSAYRYRDSKGRYRLLPLLNPNDNRPNLTYEFLGVTRVWRWTRERMRRAYEDGLIVQTKPGAVPQYKKYLHESRGRTITNDWHDIRPVLGKESLGYPTQKPVALLERIIEASTNPGDMILDPFCGCGTAVVAAHKLNRKWAGIDISPFAIDLIAQKRFPEFQVPMEGYPYDLAGARKLAREQPFKFERWAVTRIPGMAPNDQQVGDGGIDGVGYLLSKPEATTDMVLTQVKGGKYQLGHLRDFMGVIEREQAAIGVFTTVDPVRAPGARAETATKGFLSLGASQYPRAQLWSIEDYFGDRMPRLPALADPYTGKPLQQSIQMEMT